MDFHTLLTVHGVVLLTCSMSFIVLAMQFRNQAGTGSWAIGMSLIAAGLFSLALHGVIRTPVLPVLGNALPLIGAMQIVQATRKAIGLRPIPIRQEILAGFLILISVIMVTVYADRLDQADLGSTIGWFNLRAYLSSLLASFGLGILAGVSAGLILCAGVLKRRAWTIYFAGVVLMALVNGLRVIGLLWIGPQGSIGLELLNSVFLLLATASIITITIGAVTLTAGEIYWRLKQTAIRDHQTDLLNRRGFFERLPRCSDRGRGTRPFSLIVADIDRFKSINDTLGHDAGDAVIAHMAGILSVHARKSDLVARFGGEEFVVALPNTRSSDALILAERLRGAIEAGPADVAGAIVNYTASFGVAQQDGELEFDALFKRADDALFQAKNSGRNRVELGPAA